jgi:hypothetical protein
MRQPAGFHLNSRPIEWPLVPFASETGLQHFIEQNADALLGLSVIASDRRDGKRLSRIDLLAANAVGRLFVIECKHDTVTASALEQLRRYSSRLPFHDGEIEDCLKRAGCQTTEARLAPVLITIGYRYDPGLDLTFEGVHGLAYRYDGVAFSDETLQRQQAGCVALHAAGRAVPVGKHPRVDKSRSIEEKLSRLAPRLKTAFWKIDGQLHKASGQLPSRNKNMTRYSTERGDFARAAILPGMIEWSIKCPRPPRWLVDLTEPYKSKPLYRVVHMQSPSQKESVLKILHEARQQAG